MSILPRISLALLLVAGCSPEQSASVGAQPKKTLERASSGVNQALQQSGQETERLKDAESK